MSAIDPQPSALRTGIDHGFRPGTDYPGRHYSTWAAVVGDRVRRLRLARNMTLRDLSPCLRRPNGRRFSGPSLSRLERGSGMSPLYVYLLIAAELGVAPGRLLGPDDAEREVSEGELVLLRFLDRAGIEPDEAIARLATHAPGVTLPAPGTRAA